MPDYDLIAIGGGAAGLTVAIGGAYLGLRTALVERHRTGGECTWTGCVPSKALLHAAKVAASARQAASWSPHDVPPPPPTVDFQKVRGHVLAARAEIYEHETPDALRARGIAVLEGSARVRGHGAVQVNGRIVTARHIVICTGSAPAVPGVPGLAHTRYFTNETIFDDLDTLPARLAVIGGGPAGCELAQAFARLGSRATLIHSHDRLLPREDPALSPFLHRALERDGVTVHAGARLTRVTPDLPGRGAALSLHGHPDVEADAVLVTAGRRPRTDGLGLEEIGVRTGRDGIEVDSHLQTTVPGIWATGDVAGPYRLTHAAEHQSRTVLRNIVFPWKKQPVDYRAIPWCTFTDPEVGHVGFTEDEARRRHGSAISVTSLPLSRVDRAVAEDATDGVVKLVLHGRQIAGAHIVAPGAGELIQQVALAMHRRLPVDAFDMISVYPSFSYALHQAAGQARLQRLQRTPLLPTLLRALRGLALR